MDQPTENIGAEPAVGATSNHPGTDAEPRADLDKFFELTWVQRDGVRYIRASGDIDESAAEKLVWTLTSSEDLRLVVDLTEVRQVHQSVMPDLQNTLLALEVQPLVHGQDLMRLQWSYPRPSPWNDENGAPGIGEP